MTFTHISSKLLAGFAATLALASTADARVTKIVVESTVDPDATLAATGSAGAIKRISGRAYGELDPSNPLNAIIQDIQLAPKNARGKVEYVATFQLVMPSDPAKLSGLMWHDVPNRGGRITIVPVERNVGDVGLSSGWQGDNAGQTAHDQTGQDFVIVPIAKNADGSAIRGEVLGRIVNRGGPDSQPILVQTSPLPYKPADLDTRKATLTAVKHESVDGVVTVDSTIASSDWAWAKCDAANPFPAIRESAVQPTAAAKLMGHLKTYRNSVRFSGEWCALCQRTVLSAETPRAAAGVIKAGNVPSSRAR